MWSSELIGITKCKNKWCAEVTDHGMIFTLGYFKSEWDAIFERNSFILRWKLKAPLNKLPPQPVAPRRCDPVGEYPLLDAIRRLD